ncbi:signal peptide peptidase SppA [Haloparvum sp. PAK95]|uniref:signal peptide peptidase SppA n=1 Tax=Haloparvum sp. PAK95 TaxID=3418962 RepID=UPI003D2F078F
MGIRSDRLRNVVTLVGVLVALVVATAFGWVAFVRTPDSSIELAGVLVTAVFALVVGKVASNVLRSVLADYNVAEVGVEGPISRNGGRPSPLTAPIGPSAGELVDAMERADDDPNVDALVVRLNTPGGEVLPSDDIRRAAEEFDGPTVAYATDVCASGGYWIATGCDEVWAHDVSLVGSIGVIGSRPNAADLADKLGISYERFAAGDYKDAGVPLRDIEPDEREYLQGIVDDIYEQFVDTVSEGREMDPDDVRDTEARMYVGPEAAEAGLVDEIGTFDDVEARVEDRIGEPVEVREFGPQRGITEKIGLGARRVAFAAGAGIASAVTGDDDLSIEVR